MLRQYAHRQAGSSVRRGVRGATLIEILVTVVIMSFGVLSLAGLQAFSMAANQNVVLRGLASAMASDYADMMRANPAAFAAGSYDRAAAFDESITAVTAVTTAQTCAYPACTTTTLAAYEVAMMRARLKATLRAGTYALTRPLVGGVPSTTQGDLWIMWRERRTSGADSEETAFDNCPSVIRTSTGALPRCFYLRVNL